MAKALVTISLLAIIVALPTAAFGMVAREIAPIPAAWLDDPDPANWNRAGMPVPTPPVAKVEESPESPCRRAVRSPESPEDREVAAAGWILVGAAETGWGTRLFQGTTMFDGMCRPFHLQAFVFVDGVFAGTVQPGPRAPRFDGALETVHLGNGTVGATYLRYARPFPLCCPTGRASVSFDVLRTSEGPVIHPSPARNAEYVMPPMPKWLPTATASPSP